MTPSRDDIETTSPGALAQCPTCGAQFRRVRRQRYCSPACKQAAWRARHHDPLAQATPHPTPAPPTTRRHVTVYTCPDCEERYLGQQWCDDCNRPCTRTGIGGLCPACDHPIAIDELLSQHEDRTTPEAKIR
jgi:hypothetical protein